MLHASTCVLFPGFFSLSFFFTPFPLLIHLFCTTSLRQLPFTPFVKKDKQPLGMLICRAPLLPISTSERLLLMVPKETNQPWIHRRPFSAFWPATGSITSCFPSLSLPRFNGHIMSMKWKYSQFIWLLLSHWNFLTDSTHKTSLFTDTQGFTTVLVVRGMWYTNTIFL